jgi:predicted transposase/invertase (TIGR01784 family)
MSTSSPHDAVFKQFLSDPDTARDFLHIHLPPALRERCDLATLRLESGSFIESDLSACYSDILYAVETCNTPGLIYCVIEHQSSPDKLMAFRLLRYCLAAMQSHLRKGHDSLPLVVPLLFYHGTITPYPYSTNWLDLFSQPGLAATLYSQPFALVDVTVLADEEIMRHRRVALLELVQKHIRQRDMMELAGELRDLLRQGLCSREQLESVLTYLVQAGDSPRPEALLHTLAQSAPDYEELVMTIAQRLSDKARLEGIQEGRLEGILEGTLKGRQEGRQEGHREVARALLAKGVERAIVMQCTGLSEQEIDALAH